MANFFVDNDDLRFYLEKGIDWQSLVDLVENGYRDPEGPKSWQDAVESYRDILDLVGNFVAEEVAPRARTIDEQGTRWEDGAARPAPAFQEIFDQLKEMGIYGMALPRELDGMNCPMVLYFLLCEIFGRGDVSVMTHFGFHSGVALILFHYSLKEGTTKLDENGKVVETRWKKALEEILAGEAWGSMDLTEPDAGSDLAALRAKAVQGEDGVWRVTGNKIFITSGHAKYHIVLAKTKDEQSLDALSLFLVPLTVEKDGKTVKNAEVDRIEEKIGHHGSVTASVQYEDSEAELIGEPGEGFKLMLMLMNNARLGVGFESIGASENALRQSLEYAAERKSMGKTIDRHEMIADYLDEMDVTIRGLRALAVEGALAEETATRLEMKIKVEGESASTETRRRQSKLKKRARFLTPLVKYAAAESAVWIARMNMQIHGGNGYMKEFDAERILRDALVLPVYEGTSQIQALMALKDALLDGIKNPQRFVTKVATAKYNSLRAKTELERRFHSLESLSYSAQQHILFKIAKDKWSVAMSGPLPEFLDNFMKRWDARRDFSFGLLHAERLTRILADVAIAEILVKQAKRFPERQEIAERWLEIAEPRIRYNLDLIQHTGDRLLERLKTAEESSDEAA
ncbi:MAG: acyl-CoA dehydrogenase family protein [Myxococcota bacterium]